MRDKTEYVYFRESLWQSILADASSFGFLFGSLWFNYNFIGASKFVNAIILVMFLFFVHSKALSKSKRFTDKESFKKYLESL